MIAWTICRAQHIVLKISHISGQDTFANRIDTGWLYFASVQLSVWTLIAVLLGGHLRLQKTANPQYCAVFVLVSLTNYCDRRKSEQSKHRIRHEQMKKMKNFRKQLASHEKTKKKKKNKGVTAHLGNT